MNRPLRGEVWLVDLGMAAKVRPCFVLSVSPAEEERDLYTLIAHTTSTRGTRFEVAASAKFLRLGAFDAQNLVTIPGNRLIRKLGKLSVSDIQVIETAVRRWLGI